MVDTSDSTSLRVIRLPNGRYLVQPEGMPDGAIGEFDTQEEAEAYMFERMQEMDSRANDLGTLTPGGGQGVR